MTKLHDILDVEKLEQHLIDGDVNCNAHPNGELFIYNYTAKCQFSKNWTDETLACRGLIVDGDGDVVARPFRKFFNYTEVAVPKRVWTTEPVVTDKLDGSLGICYFDGEKYSVATRGSFTSDQATWATDWLSANHPEFAPEGFTALFEIIYPENRIVVNYGDTAELVFLGAINTHTGEDVPHWELEGFWPGKSVSQYFGLGSVDDVYTFATGDDKLDEEGVVLTWLTPGEPSFKLKIKHPDYVRLHRIITGINTKKIWYMLANDQRYEEILEMVPDEFYDWFQGVVKDLKSQYYEIEAKALDRYSEIMDVTGRDRKAFARLAVKTFNPGLMFTLYDGRDISEAVWKMVKPKAEKPFFEEYT